MKYLFPLFFFTICCKANAQKSEVLVLDKTPIEVSVSDYLLYTKNLKFKNEREIIYLKNQFEKSDKSVANFSDSADENWLYFNIKNINSENQKFVLLLDQTFLDKADFFLFKKDSLVSTISLSDKLTTEKRSFSSNNFTYPLILNPNKEYCVFMRLKANPQNGVVKSLLTLSDEKTYYKNTHQRQLFFGLLMGFLLVAVVAGLILYCN